jgi:hypothetical protein
MPGVIMSSGKQRSARTYVIIAAIIGAVILAEWIIVFIFGQGVPAGYP